MDKIKLDFSRNAKSYDQYAHLQKEVAHRLISRLKFFKLKPKNILDLGCGTGFCGLELQKIFPQANIINLDFSFDMCTMAKQKLSQIVCADIYRLPFKPNSIDLIVSNFTFQWCADLISVFKLIKKITVADGLFMFSTIGSTSLKELRQSWAMVDDYSRVNEFYNIYQVGDVLQQTGWQQPILDIDYITNYYPEVKNLFNEFKGLGVTNKAVKRNKGLMGKTKLNQFINNYETFRQEQGLPLSWEIIYGCARV